MGLISFLNRADGFAVCRVTGVNPALFLSDCAARGVRLYSTSAEDEYTLCITASLQDLPRLRSCAQQSQTQLELLRSGGMKKSGKKLLQRIVPALCTALFIALLVWSKLFVWEIGVVGNETVSTAKILDALRECGVSCGTFWPGLTSDNLRSELLVELPELAWATVNIYGSRAEVIVRERVPKPAMFDAHAPTDIVAAKTGFVTKVLALNGTALVQPGSAVIAGETLISGVGHSSFSPDRLLHAVGTVQAETYYELTAALPETQLVRTERGKTQSRWALIVGKNRYNFYRNSSICGETCDKISSVWNCGIEGLFQVPISIVREQSTSYTLEEVPRDANRSRLCLEETLHGYLLQCMSEGGTIESENYSCCESDGEILVCLRARCSESIGEERPMDEQQIQEIRKARTNDGTHDSSGQN